MSASHAGHARDAALTAEFLSRLRGFVQRRVRSEHDAEDIVQDVLTKLVQHDDAIDVRTVESWMFTVARRTIIDRSRRTTPARFADVDSVGSIDHPVEPSLDSAKRPCTDPVMEYGTDATVAAELARCMEPMLEALPSEDRALLARVDMLGDSQAEVARELGMSLSGLKSRVQRARARLRALLHDCCLVERDRLGQPAEYARRPDRPCPCDGCA